MKIVAQVRPANGPRLIVYYDDGNKNHYRVVMDWYEFDSERLKHRTKKLVEYANLASALFYVYDFINRNLDEEGR